MANVLKCEVGAQVRAVYPDRLIGVLPGLPSVQPKELDERPVAQVPVPEENDSTIEPMVSKRVDQQVIMDGGQRGTVINKQQT